MAEIHKFPELLTPREAAAARRTTIGHLANERSRGVGPPYCRLGGKVLYPADLLRQYIADRIIDPKTRK